MALVDGLGNLVRFVLLPGQRSEIKAINALIDGLAFDALIADKAYDADWLRQALRERDIEAVIPARAGRKAPADHGSEIDKWRHLVENFFQKLKEFKRIAMRADKTDLSFAAMINIAAAVINTK